METVCAQTVPFFRFVLLFSIVPLFSPFSFFYAFYDFNACYVFVLVGMDAAQLTFDGDDAAGLFGFL